MRFDLTSVRLFVALAQERNITRAARREHLLLSAASKRTTELENMIATPLLYRHAHRVPACRAETRQRAHGKGGKIVANAARSIA